MEVNIFSVHVVNHMAISSGTGMLHARHGHICGQQVAARNLPTRTLQKQSYRGLQCSLCSWLSLTAG